MDSSASLIVGGVIILVLIVLSWLFKLTGKTMKEVDEAEMPGINQAECTEDMKNDSIHWGKFWITMMADEDFWIFDEAGRLVGPICNTRRQAKDWCEANS